MIRLTQIATQYAFLLPPPVETVVSTLPIPEWAEHEPTTLHHSPSADGTQPPGPRHPQSHRPPIANGTRPVLVKKPNEDANLFRGRFYVRTPAAETKQID